ncbi:MAG TPA: ABC transporter permease [Anaerolineales bacterium]|nr:ABC transporter permease [Anaerolineales bacterium]
MNLLQSFFEALESLAANKLRSALTMLGIVIGVAAVVAMLAIGNGAQASIVGEIEGIGTNLLFISASGYEIANPKPLTLDDAEAIADPLAVPSVAVVAAVIQGSAEISYGKESTNTSVIGATPEYFALQNLELAEGEMFDETDLAGRFTVVILGAGAAEDIFGRSTGMVGETVRIGGQPFRVIGVLPEQGGSQFGSADDQVIIPLTTARLRLFRWGAQDQVDMIYASAVSAEAVESATSEISRVLRQRHRIILDEDDFSIMSQQSMVDMISTITGVMTIFLGGIAGISLLVGGIGIMNIMLVSVVERTREIGLRKALGARKRDVLLQFLVESSMLSLVGGVIGIILGWALGLLVGQIASANDMELTPLISLDAVLLATLFSAAVGVFFGLYPANRAAGLEPVEALRSE